MKPHVVIPLGPNEAFPERLVDQCLQNNLALTLSTTERPTQRLNPALRWIEGPKGRAQQLNRTIESCQDEWVWIIHADSQISDNAIECIQSFCASAHWTEIGYGTLAFAHDGPKAVLLNQWLANVRSKIFSLPYGDQALCIHQKLWHALKGFREDIARGEDLDFIVRARRFNATPVALPMIITTSARRYQSNGWLKTTVEHQIKAWQLIQAAKRWRP